MSNPISNVQNFGGASTFSTDEILIGTWINNKPLYQKVFHFNSLSVTKYSRFDISTVDILDNDHIVDCGLYGGYYTDWQQVEEIKPNLSYRRD